MSLNCRVLPIWTGVVILAAVLIALFVLKMGRPPTNVPFDGPTWKHANPKTNRGARARQAMANSAIAVVMAARSYPEVIRALGQPDSGAVACRDTGGWQDFCKSPDDRLVVYYLGSIGDEESAVLVVVYSRTGKVLHCAVRI